MSDDEDVFRFLSDPTYFGNVTQSNFLDEEADINKRLDEELETVMAGYNYTLSPPPGAEINVSFSFTTLVCSKKKILDAS